MLVCVVRASLQQSIHVWHPEIFLDKMLCFFFLTSEAVAKKTLKSDFKHSRFKFLVQSALKNS